MVKIIVGDYTPKKNEIVVDDYNDNVIFKNSQNNNPVVIYAESCGLKKADIQVIIKRATRDITIVCASHQPTSGLRKSKNCTIKKDYETGIMTPFELASYVMGLSDRQYLFDFLCSCKNQLYMLTRTLVSNHCSFTKNNQNWLAFIDTITWKCRPEIIYAILCFKIKPELDYRGEPKHKWMKWRYPKKADIEAEKGNKSSQKSKGKNKYIDN